MGGVWTIRQQNTNLQILLQHMSKEDNLLEGKVDDRQSLYRLACKAGVFCSTNNLNIETDKELVRVKKRK